jgi:hypothetical protein
LKEFPNGKHDDGPDALESLIRLLGKLVDVLDGSDQETFSDV